MNLGHSFVSAPEPCLSHSYRPDTYTEVPLDRLFLIKIGIGVGLMKFSARTNYCVLLQLLNIHEQ